MNIFELQLLAGRIASDYLAHHTALNESIAKCAAEKDLSRLQIHGLVAATNHAANDLLRKTADDKTYTFELADLDHVLRLLDGTKSTGTSLLKTASVLAAAHRTTPMSDSMQRAYETGSDSDKERRVMETRHILRKLAERTHSEMRKIAGERQVGLAKLAQHMDVLLQDVKNYIVQKQYTFGDICKYASAILSDNTQTAHAVMNAVAGELSKLGQPFTGMLASPKELSAESFKRNGIAVAAPEVDVVNGATPIAKTLHEVNKNILGLSDQERMLNELSSFSSYITEAETVLRTSTDVHRHLLQDLDSFHRKYMLDPCKELDKTASIINAMRGAKIVGGLAATGASTINKGVKSITGKGVLRNLAAPAAMAGTQMAGLKAGQAIAQKARKGFAYSKGTGAADTAEQTLQ